MTRSAASANSEEDCHEINHTVWIGLDGGSAADRGWLQRGLLGSTGTGTGTGRHDGHHFFGGRYNHFDYAVVGER